MEEYLCQETTGMIGEQYLRCGSPAYILVKHIGRNEGPYWMCQSCADHNIRRRGAKDITNQSTKQPDYDLDDPMSHFEG